MQTTIRKYGNSAVVALPPVLLKELGLRPGQNMKLGTTADGQIVMTAVAKRYTLDALIAQCDLKAPKPDDMSLWDATAPAGGEVW